MHEGGRIVVLEEANVPLRTWQFNLKCETLALEITNGKVISICEHVRKTILLGPHLHVRHKPRAVAADLVRSCDGTEYDLH